MCMKYEEIEGNVKKIYSVHIDEGKLVEVLIEYVERLTT